MTVIIVEGEHKATRKVSETNDVALQPELEVSKSRSVQHINCVADNNPGQW